MLIPVIVSVAAVVVLVTLGIVLVTGRGWPAESGRWMGHACETYVCDDCIIMHFMHDLVFPSGGVEPAKLRSPCSVPAGLLKAVTLGMLPAARRHAAGMS